MATVINNFETLKKKLSPSAGTQKSSEIVIQIGSATCEKAAGSDLVRDEFRKLVQASGRTDLRIKQTGCTGRCAQEPIVGVFAPGQMPVKYQKVTPAKVLQIFEEHVKKNQPVSSLMLDQKNDVISQRVVTFCASKNCVSPGRSWPELFKEKIEKAGLSKDSIRVFEGGCFGLCKAADTKMHGAMLVFPERSVYLFKSEAELEEIVAKQFVSGQIADKYLAKMTPLVEQFFNRYGDVSFFNKQSRITLRNCGIVDPESLGDYLDVQGFEALARVLEKGDSRWVIDEMTRSGLRGRGGGGFPTGQKWKSAVESNQDPVRYIVCNADEGDPGAFMDRSALEGDPFDIVEGMIIGGYAIGAHKGYAYIRAEYPLAIERVQLAIDQCRKHNLLGKNILGSGFDFDLEIRLGAGAFVCGEETALMYSIEGKRGQPRIRPPYPTTSGLWGHPTVINNVETFANVPAIFLYGADWFSNIGTKGSKGTKVFALVGKVENTGLVEVPMGTTLREVVYSIGGGIPNGRQLKAVQTGGPSGGCIPFSKIDTPVDYENLAAVGSIMGSGGMIVLDDTDCMVATARYFLEFTQDESCGKCLPCREGTLRMLEILDRISVGQGKMEDLDKLERLAKLVKRTSLCGLGQSAPNPVLSTLQNFREEFEIHIKEKRCPCQKCKKLIRYTILKDKCTGCTLCARRCPVSCIKGTVKKPHEIDQSRCIKCGECYNSCKFDAIEKR